MEKVKIVFGIVMVFGIIGYLIFENLYYSDISSSLEINGKIDELEYNEKGFPVITIHNVDYYFSTANDGRLKIGDSLIKEFGNTQIDVYRKGVYVKSYYGMVTTK